MNPMSEGRHRDQPPGPSNDMTWAVHVLARALIWSVALGLGVVVGIATVVYLILFGLD